MMRTPGERIRLVRDQSNLSQKQFAEKLGVSANTVARWERGEVSVPLIAQRFADVLFASNKPRRQSGGPDDLESQIANGLLQALDPNIFEDCAADLVSQHLLPVAPVRGGGDDGFDGEIPDGRAQPFPLISTTAKDYLGNLRRNLSRYEARIGARNRVAFATSRFLSPGARRKLYDAAEKAGFELVAVADGDFFVQALYRDEPWRLKLLGITGEMPAITVFPPRNRRPILNEDLLGRSEEVALLHESKTDVIVVGRPGVGKTFVLKSLVDEGWGFFVASNLEDRIANAVRAYDPSVLILDDVHTCLDTLSVLQDIRNATGARFRIIASCWPRALHNVRGRMHTESVSEVEIPLVDRDTVVAYARSVGITGPRALVREIVDQSEGRLGLAASLCHAVKQGGVSELVSGESLARSISSTLSSLLGEDALHVLATIALCGASGADPALLPEFLGLSPVELDLLLAGLAAAGVIDDLPSGAFAVYPLELRAQIVSKIFFGNASSRAFTWRDAANVACSYRSVLITLVAVQALGISIPGLFQLLKEANSEEVWEKYAELGSSESEYVLSSHPDLVLSCPGVFLWRSPDLTIPLLIKAAEGDNRPQNSTTSHPMRVLKDWMYRAHPGLPEVFRRRSLVVSSTVPLLGRADSATASLEALLAAFVPRYHVSESGAGSSLTVHWTDGTISSDDVRKLYELWERVQTRVETIPPLAWPKVLSEVHDLLYPGSLTGSCSEEVTSATHQLAERILVHLAGVARDSPGPAEAIRRYSNKLSLRLLESSDEVYQALFPEDSPRIQEDLLKDQACAAIEATRHWEYLSPQEIVSTIGYYSGQAGLANHSWPSYLRNVCENLAKTRPDAKEILEIAVDDQGFDHGAFHALFSSLVKYSDDPAYLDIFLRSLQSARYSWAAFSALIEAKSFHPSLVRLLVDTASSCHRAIQDKSHLVTIDSCLMAAFLEHPDTAVQVSAALGEWHCKEGPHVRPELAELWRTAVLSIDADEYWLSVMLSRDTSLAFDWLCHQVSKNTLTLRLYKNENLNNALCNLTDAQKKHVLGLCPASWTGNELTRVLVASDTGLYKWLLYQPDLKKLHLAPLEEHPKDAWAEKAVLALDVGYAPAEIARATICVNAMWSGPESKRWEEWREEFSHLQENQDVRVQEIGAIGGEFVMKELERCRNEEQREAIYGYDRLRTRS